MGLFRVYFVCFFTFKFSLPGSIDVKDGVLSWTVLWRTSWQFWFSEVQFLNSIKKHGLTGMTVPMIIGITRSWRRAMPCALCSKMHPAWIRRNLHCSFRCRGPFRSSIRICVVPWLFSYSEKMMAYRKSSAWRKRHTQKTPVSYDLVYNTVIIFDIFD